MEGRIHSIESFGTVDGPGVRMVVFLMGCPMRCQYCHNPDTWDINGEATVMKTSEILKKYERYKSFYGETGGITVSGGEPMIQIDFLTELFEKAKQKGIHTCLDTSGITYNEKSQESLDKINRLMKSTDLVMLDIKHINKEKHLELTGQKIDNILAFARYLSDIEKPVWIRHVIVPGFTDGEKEQYELGRFLATLKNVKGLDVLPYHTMGEVKYEKLGLKYKLAGVPALTDADAKKARLMIIRGYKGL